MSAAAARRVASLSIAEAAQCLRAGTVTAVELAHRCIANIRATQELHAFVPAYATPSSDPAWDVVDEAMVLEQAQEADKRQSEGASLGQLDGIPFAAKANFCVRGVHTTAASHMLDSFQPSYSATAVARLRAAGAVHVGMANMDEFAMGTSSFSSYHGAVRNPWSKVVKDAGSSSLDEDDWYTPGGSSGGSAVSVATGCAFTALGSDTGGSVRLPAAFCGVVGMRPTYGRVSRWGLIAMASALDVPGITARSVRDVAVTLDAVSGVDELDATSVALPPTQCQAALKQRDSAQPLRGMTVAVPTEFVVAELSEDMRALWQRGMDWVREAGAKVVEVSLPSAPSALAAYYVLVPADAASNLACYDGLRYGHRAQDEVSGDTVDDSALHREYTNTRTQGFGTEVQRRLLLGNYVLSQSAREEYFDTACAVQQQITREFAAAFDSGVDAFLTPSAHVGPWKLQDSGSMNPVDMYMTDFYMTAASIAGLPAVSVPAGCVPNEHANGAPFPAGLQVMAPPCHDATVLTVAAAIEAASAFELPSEVLRQC